MKEIKRKTIENDLEYLRQISTDVDLENDNYKEWLNELKEYCHQTTCYALASVQIGIPKRLIYIKNTTPDMSKNEDYEYDESIVMINPKIIEAKGHTRFLERCLSCGDYVSIVDRPYKVKIEYYNEFGIKTEETIEGFAATVFSHEYDHLNGILHMDIGENICKMSREETKKYREEHPYKIISKCAEYKY